MMAPCSKDEIAVGEAVGSPRLVASGDGLAGSGSVEGLVLEATCLTSGSTDSLTPGIRKYASTPPIPSRTKIPSNSPQGRRPEPADGSCCVFISEGAAVGRVVPPPVERVGTVICDTDTCAGCVSFEEFTLQWIRAIVALSCPFCVLAISISRAPAVGKLTRHSRRGRISVCQYCSTRS